MIRSYRQHPPEGEYAAIVVGSGMGGLATAAVLARDGDRVLVLERHYTAGGYTHVFHRSGYEWDVGVHYIGGVGKADSLLARMFDYVCGGALEWADMGEIYDRVCFGRDRYDFRKGPREFVEGLGERFPAERAAIERYVALLREVNAASRTFFAEKAVPRFVATVAGGIMRRRFARHASRTTKEVLEDLTGDARLRGVLAAQYGDYGLPPAESSFAMHAMVANHYLHGGYYPVGGAGRIAETAADVIAAAGGDVLTNAEIERILVEGRRAVGVRMADGREVRAPIVVSDAGLRTTFGRLLEGGPGTDVASRRLRPSASHLGLYLGFRHTAEELGLSRANWWIFPEGGYDHDQNVRAYLENPDAEFPLVYVSFPSAKDPDWERRHPGRATVDVITLAPYDWFAEWDGTRWMRRGEAYEALKQRFTDRLLRVLYRYEPQLEGKVDHAELSTPLSTRQFVNYEAGEIYGLAHSPERFADRGLRPSTRVKGLYLTGQDVTTCGVAGALMSGVVTVSAIRRRDYVKKIVGAKEPATAR